MRPFVKDRFTRREIGHQRFSIHFQGKAVERLENRERGRGDKQNERFFNGRGFSSKKRCSMLMVTLSNRRPSLIEAAIGRRPSFSLVFPSFVFLN